MEKAIHYCKLAASQGHLLSLGECYFFGYGKTQDLSKAFECYSKAKDQGDVL